MPRSITGTSGLNSSFSDSLRTLNASIYPCCFIKSSKSLTWPSCAPKTYNLHTKSLRSEWIPIQDARRDISAKDWLDAIGAAALLASSTEFPERSNLYQILKSPTLGHVLRRIEQKSESGQAYIYHFDLLNKLEGVLR